MKDPQIQLEEWITETLHRSIYKGDELRSRLKGLSESLGASEILAQEYMRKWIDSLVTEEIYRKVDIQNRLIDLWALITHFQSLDTDESLSPCVG